MNEDLELYGQEEEFEQTPEPDAQPSLSEVMAAIAALNQRMDGMTPDQRETEYEDPSAFDEMIETAVQKRLQPYIAPMVVQQAVDHFGSELTGAAKTKLSTYLGKYSPDALKRLMESPDDAEVIQAYANSLTSPNAPRRETVSNTIQTDEDKWRGIARSEGFDKKQTEQYIQRMRERTARDKAVSAA
jgi:hypothetical protein